jgi:hypothetical protein
MAAKKCGFCGKKADFARICNECFFGNDRDYYDIKIYGEDGVEVNPKPPEIGKCMLCGQPVSAGGWCGCSKDFSGSVPR